MHRLEGELEQIIGELELERIKWLKAASLAPLPVYLAPAFFMAWGDPTDYSKTPLALQEASKDERASREEREELSLGSSPLEH